MLLAYYYAEEQPIPLDMDEVYRMVRAIAPAERKAVEKVLAAYFQRKTDGWHNSRADHEIEVSKTARENGGKGGRKKTGHETGFDESGSASGFESGSQKGGENVTGSGHPPTTILQPPTTNPQTANHQPPGKEEGDVGLAPDVTPPAQKTAKENRLREMRSEALKLLEFLNSKTSRDYQPVPANVDLIVARLREGATVDDLRAVIAKKCREWSGDEKMVAYLRPATLFNRTKFAQYRGEIGGA